MAIIGLFIPIIIILGLGYATKYYKFFPAEQMAGLEKFLYWIGFPCLIVVSLLKTDFNSAPVLNLVISLCGAQLLMGGLTLLFSWDKKISPSGYGSIFQCQVRWNSYFSLALAGLAYGEKGIAIMSIIMTAMIPWANFLAIWGFSKFGNAKGQFAQELFKNPFIIACILGILGNYWDIRPKFLLDSLNILGQTTIALGLVSVGAALDFSILQKIGGRIGVWALVRLIIMPLIAILFMNYFNITGIAFMMGLIASSSPTATSGYVLAKKLGGDAPVMAMLICLTHLGALITMPLFMYTLIPQ